METKKQIRTCYKQKRDQLTLSQQAEYSKQICSHISKSIDFKEAREICFFHPLGSEVSLLPLYEEARRLGKVTAFPKIKDGQMYFFVIEGLDELKEGYFHVKEPIIERPLQLSEQTLVLTPGLVFDLQGMRYGYGKGFYDTFFSQNPEVKKTGVAYQLQVVLHLSVDETDKAVTHLYTENGCIF